MRAASSRYVQSACLYHVFFLHHCCLWWLSQIGGLKDASPEHTPFLPCPLLVHCNRTFFFHRRGRDFWFLESLPNLPPGFDDFIHDSGEWQLDVSDMRESWGASSQGTQISRNSEQICPGSCIGASVAMVEIEMIYLDIKRKLNKYSMITYSGPQQTECEANWYRWQPSWHHIPSALISQKAGKCQQHPHRPSRELHSISVAGKQTKELSVRVVLNLDLSVC